MECWCRTFDRRLSEIQCNIICSAIAFALPNIAHLVFALDFPPVKAGLGDFGAGGRSNTLRQSSHLQAQLSSSIIKHSTGEDGTEVPSTSGWRDPHDMLLEGLRPCYNGTQVRRSVYVHRQLHCCLAGMFDHHPRLARGNAVFPKSFVLAVHVTNHSKGQERIKDRLTNKIHDPIWDKIPT